MQNEIKVIIIEDEPIWAHNLAADLDNFGYTITGTANDFESAVTLLNNQPFDIALLDINIKGRNSGIELGKMIDTLYRKPFIFITADQNGNTVKEAIQVKPSAYLIKPANPSSLLVAIQNAINNFNSNAHSYTGNLPADDNSFFFVKHGDRYKKIFWQDVSYFRSDRNYTFLFNTVDTTEYPIRSSLTRTYNYLIPPPIQNKFLQINRSEFVQLAAIREIAGNEVKTLYKTFLVSEAFLKEVKKVLNVLS